MSPAPDRAARQLQDALMKEADRRQQMGDYVVAHELRGHASRVATAASMLRASKERR